jgi:hypothetical protein
LQTAENSYRVLADGGYFENSGAETAIDLIGQIQEIGKGDALCRVSENIEEAETAAACGCNVVVETSFRKGADWTDCQIPIFIAYMPISSWGAELMGYEYGDDEEPPQSYFLDPISTMLEVRNARGVLALQRAERALLFEGVSTSERTDNYYRTGLDEIFFPHLLPISEMELPLGWKLSSARVREIVAVSAPKPGCRDTSDIASDDQVAHATRSNACTMQMLAWLLTPATPDSEFGNPYDG